MIDIWPMDASQTRTHAIAEDPGRPPAWLASVIGSIASLGAIAIVHVAASWALIQINYTLRIAGIYYSEPAGGIDFNSDEEPSYTDFAYLSLGVGMS